MKLQLTFLLIGLWFAAGNAQNILVVDNTNSGLTGDHIYTDLATAVEAAQAWDIIHIMPTTVAYGGVTIDKPLSLIGSGFNPEIETHIYVSRVNSITLTSEGAGLRIAGLIVNTIISSGNLINGVVISHCMVGSMNFLGYGTTFSNSSISNCILTYQFRVMGGVNLSIHNNVVLSTGGTVDPYAFDSAILSNNVFVGVQNERNVVIINSCVVSDNIFYWSETGGTSTGSGVGSSYNSVFENNIVLSEYIDSADALISSQKRSTGSGNIFEDPLLENISSGGISGNSSSPVTSLHFNIQNLDLHLKPTSDSL